MTYTGRQFWPLDPRAEDIHILDIAHALSMKCRWGGHCGKFMSVANHCCLCAEQFGGNSKREYSLRLWALMHDAAEAYLPDVPTPIKDSIPGFVEMEDRILKVVAEKYGMEWPMPRIIKQVDERVRAWEFQVLMNFNEWPESMDSEWGCSTKRTPDLFPWGRKKSRVNFLAWFSDCVKSIKGSA